MLELITLPYARPRWSGLLRQLFEDYQENAVTEPVIVAAIRGTRRESDRVTVLKWNENWPIENLSGQVAVHGIEMPQTSLSPEVWRLESREVLALLAKLRTAGESLGDLVGDRFYYGI